MAMHSALPPLFKLLADDARLRILQTLSEKDMYVVDLGWMQRTNGVYAINPNPDMNQF